VSELPRSEDAPPILAVVGHPNKGKSSLVATLAEDDSVGIGANPGTTLRARAYPMRVDGRLLYTLVDTPGFQRSRRVLAWLEDRAATLGATAADRPRLVADFVSEPGNRDRFPDECELLAPLVAGAGILYVVDGGVPYGPEYEAEMEILRWTGRPSLAVINPIHRQDHLGQWRAALGQFFRVVRVVDAMKADFATRRGLLLAFGELDERWHPLMGEAVSALDSAREQRRLGVAREIVGLLADALTLSVEHRLAPEEDPERSRDELESEYRRALASLESRHRGIVQRLHGHREIQAHASEIALLESDLFSEGTWLRFGLRRRDLVAVGAVGGAATGAVVDASLGGAALLVGTAIGGAIGGTLGWLSASRLAELRVVNQPLGGRVARYGPSRNRNFPFVLLGRARYHAGLLATRSHARRDIVELPEDVDPDLTLEGVRQRSLAAHFASLARAGPGSARRHKASRALLDLVGTMLFEDEQRLIGAAESGDGESRG
jgi:hypothetical protein